MIPDLIAGDDWELHFTVLNPDGTPFNLTGGPTILWTAIDKNGASAIESNEVNTAVSDAPNGKVAVHVASEVTTRLLTNFYGHALRIIQDGITATPFTGQLNVLADPYAAPASSAQVVDFSKASRTTKVIAGSPLRQIPYPQTQEQDHGR
jgi:hypothetical protein